MWTALSNKTGAWSEHIMEDRVSQEVCLDRQDQFLLDGFAFLLLPLLGGYQTPASLTFEPGLTLATP